MEKSEKLANTAIAAALREGAEYADARIVDRRFEMLELDNGGIQVFDNTRSSGFGVRVLSGGAWGFDCSPLLNESEAKKIGRNAALLAKACSKLRKKKIKLLPVKPFRAYWGAKVKLDPFKVPLKQKVDFLRELSAKAFSFPQVKNLHGGMDFESEHKVFASSEGSFIVQDLLYSAVGYLLNVDNGDGAIPIAFNSEYPPWGWNGNYHGMGYETVNERQLKSGIAASVEKGLSLLSDMKEATTCPTGIIDCIGGLDIHHFAGHPIELDRINGAETNFAGTTFIKTDDLGKLKIGSKLINLEVNGNTVVRHRPKKDFGKYWKYFEIIQNKGDIYSPANYGYDDEGVPAKRLDIIKEGVLLRCLNSRETAQEAGQEYLTASMRAHGWNRPPIIRMHNMHILPGSTSIRKLIESTERGLIIGPPIPGMGAVWEVTQSRDRSKSVAPLGLSWEIKNGKIIRPVKGGIRSYEPLQLWKSVDAVCDEEVSTLDIVRCGKGQPHQSVVTFHRSSIFRQKNGVIE